jgi:flagellar biogenesis protein FliO
MFSSLSVVIALFFGLMFMLKKANGGNMQELPRDVFQVMGTSRVAGRHSLFLLRLGHKLVLVHAGSGEVQTITEVTDPVEVDRLCGSCEENQSNSLTQSFKQVLKNVTEGTNGKSKSFADNLRFRNKAKEDADEVSPAVALLAKEKT